MYIFFLDNEPYQKAQKCLSFLVMALLVSAVYVVSCPGFLSICLMLSVCINRKRSLDAIQDANPREGGGIMHSQKKKKTNLFVHNLGVPIDGRQLFLSGCIFRFDFVVDFLKIFFSGSAAGCQECNRPNIEDRGGDIRPNKTKIAHTSQDNPPAPISSIEIHRTGVFLYTVCSRWTNLQCNTVYIVPNYSESMYTWRQFTVKHSVHGTNLQ